MINDRKILGIIPARGGSKGLPGKNIKPLNGKPLIAWTLEAASQSHCLDRTIVSTDSQEIIATARHHGADIPFTRPDRLAADTITTMDVIEHAIDEIPGYDIIVILQPTSPLRTARDIDAAIELMLHSQAQTCVSVCQTDKSPYWMYELDNSSHMKPLLTADSNKTRRQDLPDFYSLNGAIYVATSDSIKKHVLLDQDTVAYIMPKERSIDIDDATDFAIASALASQKPKSC